jgi:hypothetical protein
MLILMAGLPGSGKTTLARELAAQTSGRVVSKDEIRHALFRPEEIEYSSRQDDFCMQIMLQTAAYLLERQREMCVFLDGRTFSRRLRGGNPGGFSNAYVPIKAPNSASSRGRVASIPQVTGISNSILR